MDRIKRGVLKHFIWKNKMEKQNKLIRIRSVLEMTAISKSYIYLLVKEGKFPKPIRLVEGGTAVAWIESDVQSWIDSRVKARDESLMEVL